MNTAIFGLDDRGIRIRFPAGREFSLLHTVKTGCGAHPNSYPVGTGGSPGGDNGPGLEAIHSPPPNAEVNKLDAS
jgi:hypothetical protein